MSPDGPSKPLPEEKLLRLIRGKEPRLSTAPAAPAAGRGAAATLGGMVGVKIRVQDLPWITLAVGVLASILVVELIALAMQVVRPLPAITTPAVPTAATGEPATGEALLPGLPSLAESASQMVFASPATASPPSATPIRPGPSQTGKLLASRLTLMGIVSGDPAQAIIEDAETKKTYFVSAGQAVAEGATLEQVLDNRVILDLNGEKIELSL